MQPTSIKHVEGVGLEIKWGEDQIATLTYKLIRDNCPSAESRAKRGEGESHDAPLTATRKSSGLRVIKHTLDESLTIVRLWPVGRYAIGIEWGDGLKSGIYPFTLLLELAGHRHSDPSQVLPPTTSDK